MNYRHLYHAGNFADVFKHVVLVQILKALQRKDKGLAFLETHAGTGRYDLRAPEAQKSGEFREGIGRLWEGSPLEGFDDYLNAVRAANPDGTLRYYPGSPGIARYLLRPQDRMYLAELFPDACAELQQEFSGDKRMRIRCADGYAALKGWLPPPERRGFVLIDPAYERPEEWERLGEALRFAAERWPQGTWAIWYPLKAGTPLNRFKSGLEKTGLRNLLSAELAIWPLDTPFRLNGCGVLIYNPPWRLDEELRPLLDALADRLRQGPTSGARIDWVVPE
jgi:23S rRNA (adenine2030-N6)-methyltransferase